MADKFTFAQFATQYPDDDACLAAILERRYGKAEACPECAIVGKLTSSWGSAFYSTSAVVWADIPVRQHADETAGREERQEA